MPPKKLISKEIEDKLDRLYPAPSEGQTKSEKGKKKRQQNRRQHQKRLLDKYEKEQSKIKPVTESVTESIEVIEKETAESSISSRTRSKYQK